MRYYKAGGEVTDIYERAEKVTGASMDKLRAAGLDTDKFENLSDSDIQQLYNLVMKYKSDFQPEEKGNTAAVIAKAVSSLPRIKKDLNEVSKMTGVSKSDLKEIGYGLVDQSEKLDEDTKSSINTSIKWLLQNGGYIR